MIRVAPGEDVPLCVVADPDYVGSNTIRAVIQDLAGNTVATVDLEKKTSRLWCAFTQLSEGEYIANYQIVDSSGNMVADIEDELIIVRNWPATVPPELEQKIDKIYQLVAVKRC